jgi:hypothetical protein
MVRNEVYDIINGERDHQDHENRTQLSLEQEVIRIIAATNELVMISRNINTDETLDKIREIAGICVRVGEHYPLPRKKKYKNKYVIIINNNEFPKEFDNEVDAQIFLDNLKPFHFRKIGLHESLYNDIRSGNYVIDTKPIECGEY